MIYKYMIKHILNYCLDQNPISKSVIKQIFKTIEYNLVFIPLTKWPSTKNEFKFLKGKN